MALTLAQAKVTMQNKIDQFVIDEFRRSSLLLDSLTFDDAVSPGTGGSTLTYGYTRLLTPSTAGPRAINAEYTANEAKRTKATTDLKIFGGAFELDRVIQDTSGSLNEIQFQLQQKVLGARNYFHYQAINGNSTTNALTFDGLSKILTGSDTEFTSDADLSEITPEVAAQFMEDMDNFLSELDGRPTMLMGNSKLINKIKSIARAAGYYSRTENAFGQTVDNYDNIPLVDMGYYWNGTATVPVIPVTTTGTTDPVSKTDLYAVNLALDGFHGITPQGGVGIRTYLPNLADPGAVKKGEVEMVAGLALKATRKAAVLRDIII